MPYWDTQPKSQGKNHRKTKIPFPFPTIDLQLLKTALHYHRRGWGYTSLFGRACAREKPSVTAGALMLLCYLDAHARGRPSTGLEDRSGIYIHGWQKAWKTAVFRLCRLLSSATSRISCMDFFCKYYHQEHNYLIYCVEQL